MSALNRTSLDKSRDLKNRTQIFAIEVIRMCRGLPRSLEAKVLGNQVLRPATSVGANYRSAQRGKSKADFISKLATAEEEADETCYWLELILAAELIPANEVERLMNEAGELTAILTAAGRTAKLNRP